jgi:predicted site-specific integrase-resolvase
MEESLLINKKNDLERQIDSIKIYCNNNSINISNIYSDISSGIDLDRNNLNKLINDVINLNIKNIYISHRDRLTRLSFRTLQELFNKFGTNIIIINNNSNESNDNEIFEELISLMHIFSTTMYSNRRKNKVNIYYIFISIVFFIVINY